MLALTLSELTVEMSNNKQIKGKILDLNMDVFLTFYGVVLTSGYSSVPGRHMFWSYDPDVYYETISNAMRRNCFDEIMASIHLVNNSKATNDHFYEVRPIFSSLNGSYKMMPYQEWLLHDKSKTFMQFIQGKPIQFGYKLLCLA